MREITGDTLEHLFLTRLERLLCLRKEYITILNAGDWRLRMLNKAIYSTFCDCHTRRATEQARDLFAKYAGGQEAAPCQ